ncbi:hypothetical protein [Ralstonia phage RSP15]|uniref:hypothetical protein n=1 Tax=Ralstonia phage RSP15 TaxID=1785960 RepID=UPI00074D37F2|nr:hypothetical protein BH754_gp183 [Ralstonia phage RSP15]BAU40123.1 hypothetical protein [Ralstonia phage RSP15]
MSQKSVEVSFPLLGVLGIVFVVLKLCGVINWSWWLVLLPFYFGLAIVVGILAFAGLVYLLHKVLKGIADYKKQKAKAAK